MEDAEAGEGRGGRGNGKKRRLGEEVAAQEIGRGGRWWTEVAAAAREGRGGVGRRLGGGTEGAAFVDVFSGVSGGRGGRGGGAKGERPGDFGGLGFFHITKVVLVFFRFPPTSILPREYVHVATVAALLPTESLKSWGSPREIMSLRFRKIF